MILTDTEIIKAIGYVVVGLISIIVGLLVYYWNEYKTNQISTNASLGTKIDQVTSSLNMFIEETVSLKEDISEIKVDVAVIRREMNSIEKRVEKHGIQIDDLNKTK